MCPFGESNRPVVCPSVSLLNHLHPLSGGELGCATCDRSGWCLSNSGFVFLPTPAILEGISMRSRSASVIMINGLDNWTIISVILMPIIPLKAWILHLHFYSGVSEDWRSAAGFALGLYFASESVSRNSSNFHFGSGPRRQETFS